MPDVLFAFDRQTARSRDADGRMRVKNCILTTAEINPYRGSEIVKWKELGLDPDKVYDLYRDPDELRKAIKTFDGLPLMVKHIAQTANEPRKDYIGGSVHNITFDGKRMRGDLLVWDGAAIELIESDEASDLSCSYRYVPVMRSGTVDGASHDGVMTAFEGNHVALVDDGRASDAHVADAAFAPKLSDPSTEGANDMAVPEQPGAPAPAAAPAAPAAGAPGAAPAPDAGMAEVGAALKQIALVLGEVLAAVKPQQAEAPAPAAPAAPADPNAPPAGAADFNLEPAVPKDGTVAMQNAGAADADMPGEANEGDTVQLPGANQEGTPARGGNTPDVEVGPTDPVTAMDAKSVQSLITAAVKRERDRAAEVQRAKNDVRHVLGGDLAMDSAGDIYREALTVSGVDVSAVPKGQEKLAWTTWAHVSAVSRGAHVVQPDMAHDAAVKTETASRLNGMLSRISVKG